MSEVDALVVGGGISGLATAAALAQAGFGVAVWERAERPGGKIRSDRHDGYLTEQAASLMLNFRPEVSRFVDAAGLERLRVPVPAHSGQRRYVVHDGRLRPVPMTLSGLLLSPLWSWSGKLRLLAEPLIPRRVETRESAGAFVRRRLGRELLDKAIEPYVAGTLAADPEQASAHCVLPRLTALERRYGSIALGILARRLHRRQRATCRELFSFAGGMDTLVEHLAADPRLLFAAAHRVVEIAPSGSAWRVTAATPGGERCILARQIVLCAPAPDAAALLQPTEPRLSELLSGIDYAPMSVVHVGMPRAALDHPLNGMGFLTPRRSGLRISGCQWISSLFPERAPQDHVLLTSYLGGCRLPEVGRWSDAACVDAVLRDLRGLLGIRGAPAMVRVVRHPRALPLYHGDYHARCTEIASRVRRLPGIHLQANYLGGVPVRDRIAQGMAVTRRIAQEMGTPQPRVRDADLLATAVT